MSEERLDLERVEDDRGEARRRSGYPDVMVEDVGWDVRRSGDRVVVIFGERVTEEAGRDSVARFIEVMGSQSIDLVFDVRRVRGYESAARRAWQRALWPRRRQIASLTVVSQSALTKLGAQMFGAFLRIPVHITSSLPDVFGG